MSYTSIVKVRVWYPPIFAQNLGVKQKAYQVIEGLPSESFEELFHFLDFLKFKYQIQRPRKVVALGGLWKDLDFDVTHAEVRALRRRVTAQLLQKV